MSSDDSKPTIGRSLILSADDHYLLRYCIVLLAGAGPDMDLVARASTGREAIEQFL